MMTQDKKTIQNINAGLLFMFLPVVSDPIHMFVNERPS